MPESIDTAIAMEARDLLPETWDALADADTFGPAALDRRHKSVIRRVFGVELTDAEIDVLDPLLIEYVGMRLALAIIPAGIDFWSTQVLSLTAGERESKSYKDRAAHLRELASQLTKDAAALYLDVEPLIPQRPRRASDAPRVIQAGDTVPHITPNIDDIAPLYGPAEDIEGTSAT